MFLKTPAAMCHGSYLRWHPSKEPATLSVLCQAYFTTAWNAPTELYSTFPAQTEEL